MGRLRFSKLPAKERAKIAAAIRAGDSVSEIAKAFGVSRRTVYNHKAQVEEVDLLCRTAVLTVRLNKKDIEELDKLAERESLTRAETARRVLLRATDVFMPQPAEVEALQAIGLELAKFGSNLNQITHAINMERKYGGLGSTDDVVAALERVEFLTRQVHREARLVRSEVLTRSRLQRLRNEDIFSLIGKDPVGASESAVEATDVTAAPDAANLPQEAPEDAPSGRKSRSLAALSEKFKPKGPKGPKAS